MVISNTSTVFTFKVSNSQLHERNAVSGLSRDDDLVAYRTEKAYPIRYFRRSILVKIGKFLPNVDNFKLYAVNYIFIFNVYVYVILNPQFNYMSKGCKSKESALLQELLSSFLVLQFYF